MPIRILLIDDHALFRSGVKMLLSRQPDFEVVDEASDALEGIKRAKQWQPDVILLDLHMPGMSGREALGALREEVPGSHVVMLTVSEDGDDLLDCLKAGATGYLLKNIDVETFANAVRRACDGDSVISPEMTGKLVRGLRQGASQQPSRIDSLSPREREILGYLAKGAANKEIARALALAESTVKIHVQAILRKLDLQSRVQAAVFAVENGFSASG
ncbi:MAG: response regulator transcription factor [Burkholderiales bacterium]